MELSKYQKDIIEKFMNVAPKIIFANYEMNCCIAAARITIDALKKLHFKNVRPFVVEANIFNKVYFTKGRTPENDEEAQQWLTEGAWHVILGDRKLETTGKWPGHLVVLVNDAYMLDLAVQQADRPQKQIALKPLFLKVPDSFVLGEDKCGLVCNECLLAYVSYPDDTTYQKAKDWYDKGKADALVKRIVTEVNKK